MTSSVTCVTSRTATSNTVTITVNQPTTATINKTACNSYLWHGTTYTTSGSYTFDSLNAKGCDSLTTLNLTISKVSGFNPLIDTVRACGDSVLLSAGTGYATYTWNTGASSSNITVKQSGSYYITVANINGCTATDSSYVSIVKANIINKDTTICKGSSVTLSIDSLIVGNNSSFSSLPSNLRNGLVGYWPFNGNANDESGNGNNGTVYGASLTTDRNGDSGRAYNFNGNGNYILIHNSSSLNPKSITFSFWAKFNNGNCGVISKFDSTTYNNYGYSIIYNFQNKNTGLFTGWNTSGSCTHPTINDGYTFGSSGKIQNNLWQHVVVTIDSNGQCNQYLNGLYTYTYSHLPLKSCNSDMSLLHFGMQWMGDPCWMNGKLDDIAIYNRSLSSSEVQQLYNLKPKVTWSTGDSSNSIIVKPSTTTTYYVTVSDGVTTCKDSVKVTVNQPTTSITNASICAGASYTFNGTAYTTAGTYVAHLTNAVGCDSAATLNLTIKALSTSTTNASICTGASYTFNGTAYTTAGTYVAHLTNAVGCDSAATLNLTVTPTVTPSVTISASATTISSGSSVTFIATPINGGTTPLYQWVNNGSIISGATSDTLITTTLNNKDTITCVLTSSIGCVTNASVTSNAIGITVNYLFTISGSVKNPLGTVIPTVTVGLNGTQSVTTDANGNYSYSVASDSSFVVMPSKNNDKTIANGINGTDISLIQSHILKKVILNSPYKLIAADVNSDGSVNGTDIALIKSLILKRITKFTGNKLWAFVDSSYTFPTPTKPFPFHDSISISNISANQTSQNFIGVKLGDVNYDWNSAVLGTNLSSKAIELFNDKIEVSPIATEVRVPVKVNNFKNIMGMQYTLNYNSDVLELKSIENNNIGIDYNTDYAAEGKLPFLWVDAASNAKTLGDGSVLFELVFNKKGNLNNEDISLTSDITSASAFDGNYGSVGIVKAVGTISDAASIVSADSWNVVPNPTRDGLVKVAFSLAKAKKIQFELTSLEGKLLMQQANDFPIGNSSIVLDLQKQVRLAPGIYYLKAIGVDGVNTKQVLFVR